MKHAILGAVCTSLLVAISGAAQAALIDRGGGLIYDTDLNITWLANANYGAGSSYDSIDGTSNGAMDWQNAVSWAMNLSYYDSVRNVTYDDWRLPTTLEPDPSCQQTNDGLINCTGSELGHLFYNELGGVAGYSLTTTHNDNYYLFTNIVFNYWSGTIYSSLGNSYAWSFSSTGRQGAQGMGSPYLHAWAVRDGDVAAIPSMVPLPTAVWLFASGLLALAGMSRKCRC
ncbi:MAG: DUF1566 domain-containing protein [Gammaproteobacteria bacterium]|nr:DUF1566 domain-containing protein [Gammaproteobacteria bacterium]